jgi:solute carrier family 25 2-oxodicarboxylate transporter 21
MIQIFSFCIISALSGFCEGLVVQPFDMVKTRHQLNSGHNESVLKTLQSIYREGGIPRFYRGMAAELIGIVPKSSGMYASYEMVRRELVSRDNFGDTSLSAAIAGWCSGWVEAAIVSPTQVIKVRVQAKEHLGKYHGSVDCLTKLIKEEGPKSLFIGLGPTIWRNTVWNTVYFGSMHFLKAQLPVATTKLQDLSQTFISGFFGAIFATCFNAPFDVVKSRFQSQLPQPAHLMKYRYTLQSLYVIYKEEGLASCYKGFRPKAIRMGLGGAVSMAVFELIQYVA